ncbi:MAG TPA: endolytic transglycosylase MltG, partial [Paludibacteraceae bacterium]|nr:endolytic transglycosylase MltG [Paludibacteraceae bacterium]
VVKLQETGTVKNIQSFIRTAKNNGYPESMVPGRYELEDGMSNYMLVHRLINGRQTPLRITFNNIRTKEVLAQRLSKQMMMDSLEMINALNNDTLLSRYGLTRPTAVALFIPNTYEVYWDISPEKLMDKMKVEYDKFWTEERLQKLNDVGLTQLEVSTLASIVDEETNKKDEKPLIAGLYLNRLNKGMPLQADPTVKFAVQDFSLRRIYSGHLETDSPYNTYKHAGLPPGPIRIPSTEGIDAVLNYVDHDYMYMCAREDRSGYHNFATTFEEHLKNASKYRNTLNQRGVQ